MNGSHVRYVMYEIHYAIMCLFSVNIYVMVHHAKLTSPRVHPEFEHLQTKP